jgi:hypothetical protein
MIFLSLLVRTVFLFLDPIVIEDLSDFGSADFQESLKAFREVPLVDITFRSGFILKNEIK